MTDADLIKAMRNELAGKPHAPMDIVFRPDTVLSLAGLIELALQHPDLGPALRRDGAVFLAGVRDYFNDCPAICEVIRRGGMNPLCTTLPPARPSVETNAARPEP